MINIAVINSTVNTLEAIKKIINTKLFYYDYDYKIHGYSKYYDFDTSFHSIEYEIILIDAVLFGTNKSNFLKQIESYNCTSIILILFSKTLCLEDYIGVNIFAFVNLNEVNKLLPACIIDCFQNITKKMICVKTTTGFANINKYQIIYFKYIDRQIVCHTLFKEFSIIGTTLKSFMNSLNNHNFIYINRSIVINLIFFREVNNGFIYLNHCPHKLPLSKDKEKQLIFYIRNNDNKIFSFI